jgi:hypothetical protein
MQAEKSRKSSIDNNSIAMVNTGISRCCKGRAGLCQKQHQPIQHRADVRKSRDFLATGGLRRASLR